MNKIVFAFFLFYRFIFQSVQCLEYLKNINITTSEKTNQSRVEVFKNSTILERNINFYSRLIVIFCIDWSIDWYFLYYLI